MMEKIKRLLSGWLTSLFVTILVLTSVIGCGSSSNVEETVALATLEESAETGTASGEQNDPLQEEPSQSEAEITADVSADGAATSIESEAADAIDEDGHYISKEEVALYIHTYGKLPSNFISKKEAEELGWKQKQGEAGQLHVAAPGMSIGGSRFGNYEGLLPEADGRKYYECDINYVKGNRGAERIVYSNDGLIFYTGDHYESFEQLYPVE